MSKGSAPRPVTDRKQFAANYDAIFTKSKDKAVIGDKQTRSPWRQYHVDLVKHKK
tara:strand:+ start:443 stop:607 length:165 start_codon:yes stop_codon:yes gene_type:complete